MRPFLLLIVVLTTVSLQYCQCSLINRPMGFEAAAEYCEVKSQSLVIARTPQKMSQITGEVVKVDPKIKHIWTGVRRDDFPIEKPFHWKYSGNINTGPIQRAFWAKEEPKHNVGLKHRCVAIQFSGDFSLNITNRWVVQDCDTELPFYCEYY